MKSKTYKSIELFIIFILLPVSFVFSYAPIIKGSLGLIGFLYVIYILLKVENQKFKIAPNLNWTRFWKLTLVKLVFIALLTSLFVWFTDREDLFEVVINKPKMWILFLLIYSFFSVYPQELLYRTFFFKRYSYLFKSEWLFLFVNAILFSLAHLFFKNGLVLVITFLGGFMFALTFNKTKSTLLVSIEHAIYGSWLFTVGMGAMLGFPT
ncbi:CPBP family intramembrane glutamic endopeptidase [Mariniflexile sp. AS56]|uniref:CPBP family intramembrane glutamic endopeptidase n=1 Tax=Mariniflexile sp. AS56 TaxID=3063957 RepID=UPI0026F00C36|nr:CPBP family intramembrane glutamic endopeptidase [Mariniflexile sp. AS56]MDO7172589.1 CPBP family intramembrane metalloprotease [Mariniflexile sp. AS56]